MVLYFVANLSKDVKMDPTRFPNKYNEYYLFRRLPVK
ncbi:MAG: hypothetical protein ACI8RD_006867 [Bacillariaceae sp.]|jgi:hypothetical protein